MNLIISGKIPQNLLKMIIIHIHTFILSYLQDILESSIANSTPWILLLWSQKISCNLRKGYFFTGQTQGGCYILLHVWKFVNYPTPGSFGEETITRSKGHLWFSHVKKVLLFALGLHLHSHLSLGNTEEIQLGMGRAKYRLEYLLGQNYQYRIYAFQIQL